VTRDGLAVRIERGPLRAQSMRVPNDFSAAAFWMVAACVHPDAEIRLTGVGINPTRTGLLDALRMMRGDVSVEEERVVGGEPVSDIVARSSRLEGIEAGGDLVLRAMDEIPALAVAAAFARGTTVIRDAEELRVKESDRIATVAAQLAALGARVQEHADGMTIEGGKLAGGEVASFGDHRLAMAMAAAALAGGGDVRIGGAEAASVSYPSFWDDLAAVSGG
jgi:3-phosphoshikimate 1-carboxyvinyltransferase